MYVCGANNCNQLDKNSNEENLIGPIINPHIKFHIDPSSMLSFSTYYEHTVWITHDGKAYAIGDNFGEICGSLPQERFLEAREVILKDEKGKPFKFISVVCGLDYTLYLVSSQSKENNFQLVYCHFLKEPLLLNIVFSSPISLFGSNYTSGAVDSSGRIIVIKKSIFNSPKKRIESTSLPSGDRAVKLALCDEFLLSLGSSGRVYESKISNEGEIELSEISELKKEAVVDVAGSSNFCFVVLSDGRVFGRGSNSSCCLGLREKTKSVSTFTFIDSLKKYKIVSAFAGCGGAIFKTDKAEMIVCGHNMCGQLFIPLRSIVYPPVKIDEFSGFSFCVTGNVSAVFVGIDPPPNIPNKKIEQSSNEKATLKSKKPKSRSMSKMAQKTTPASTDTHKASSDQAVSSEMSREIERLKCKLFDKEEEILRLREENSKLKTANRKYKEKI